MSGVKLIVGFAEACCLYGRLSCVVGGDGW